MKSIFLGSCRRMLLALLRARVTGTELLTDAHAASAGRLLVTANHVSFLDGILIALSSPVHMHYVVEPVYALENRLTRVGLNFLSSLGLGIVVPMDSQSPYGIRTLRRLLEEGRPVMIFPEGRIGTGERQPNMPGVAWLLKRTCASEFGIHIAGAERSRFFGRGGTTFWPAIRITYGIPLNASFSDSPRKARVP